MIIKPVYDISEKPNATSKLITCSVDYEHNGQSVNRTAEVWLELAPRPAVVLKTDGAGIKTSLDHGLYRNLRINGQLASAMVSNLLLYEQSLEWTLCEDHDFIIEPNEETELHHINFHLFNCKRFKNAEFSVKEANGACWSVDKCTLNGEGWRVELNSLRTTREVISELGNKGGYGHTHMGCLLKEDGSTFQVTEAKSALLALEHFLSFSRGFWCSIVLPVGYNSNDKIIWKKLNWPSERWCDVFSWYNQESNSLIKLFPEFMTRWNNLKWQNTMHVCLYWYLNSNYSSRGVDAGLILSQAALERLVDQFKISGSNAGEKFRRLFNQFSIPVILSPSSPNLSAIAKRLNWQDAVHAIVDARNALVHVNPKAKQLNNWDIGFEAWNLSQWYLEQCFLRLMKYQGYYLNRVTRNIDQI